MQVPPYDSGDRDHQRLSLISLQAHRQRENTRESSLLSRDLEQELAEIVRGVAGRPAKLARK